MAEFDGISVALRAQALVYLRWVSGGLVDLEGAAALLATDSRLVEAGVDATEYLRHLAAEEGVTLYRKSR